MSGSFLRRRAERLLQEQQRRLEQAKHEQAAESDDPAAAQTPQRASPGAWRGLVEQRIQEGIERGAFDNLAGAGKPLNLDEDAMVPEDMRMAFRLLRSNGLAPLWVQLNREIRDDIERLHRFRAFVTGRWHDSNALQREHHRRDFMARVRDINDRILHYNITAPSLLVHLPMLIMDDEVAKFDRATGDV